MTTEQIIEATANRLKQEIAEVTSRITQAEIGLDQLGLQLSDLEEQLAQLDA